MSAAPGAWAELEWEYIRHQLDAMLQTGLSRLKPELETPPRELHLELTHRCNLKCVMCEHWDMEHRDPASVARELTFDQIRAFVERSPLLAGVSDVVITGGEPWMREDFVDVIAWLSQRLPKALIIALTNFWNTGHIKLKLQRLRERGVANLKLGSSLDGLEATHDRVRGQQGAFRGLVRSVELLRREFPEMSFGFTFTILPENVGEILRAYRFVSDELRSGFGAQWAIQTDGIAPIRWTDQARREGARQLGEIVLDICRKSEAIAKIAPQERRKHLGLWSELLYWRYLQEYGLSPRRFDFFLRCTAGERHVMVGAEGEVFFCPVNRARTIGNARDSSADELWGSPRAAQVRDYVASGQCHCWLRCVSTPAVDRLLGLA